MSLTKKKGGPHSIRQFLKGRNLKGVKCEKLKVDEPCMVVLFGCKHHDQQMGNLVEKVVGGLGQNKIKNVMDISFPYHALLVMHDLSSASDLSSWLANNACGGAIPGKNGKEDRHCAYHSTVMHVTLADDSGGCSLNSVPSEYCGGVPGLAVLCNYISEDEETELIQAVNIDMNPSATSTDIARRTVIHYGYEFNYKTRSVDLEKPLPLMPDKLRMVCSRLRNESISSEEPDQITLNVYRPGQGIAPHVDTHSAFEDPLISLSLMSDTIMDFRHPDGQEVSVFLPRRSLAVLSGASRYGWTHGIRERKSDVVDGEIRPRGTRVSLTLRKTRCRPCHCDFKELCDTWQADPQSSGLMLGRNLEEKHVWEFYDNIHSQFSNTRHTPWPKVVDFVNSLPSYCTVADCGAGNGRYSTQRDDLMCFASDTCFGFAKECRDKGVLSCQADVLTPPLRKGAFDAVMCIAVLHHISTYERRLQAVKSLCSLLNAGGRLCLHAWACKQSSESRRVFQGQDVMVPWVSRATNSDSMSLDVTAKDPKEKPSKNGQEMSSNRAEMMNTHHSEPKTNTDEKKRNYWQRGDPSSAIHRRFCHLFVEGELEDLISKSGFKMQLQESCFDHSNWHVVAMKLE